MQVGLGPGHIVLDGNPSPVPKNGAEPPFSAHFYCGQTAGYIKMSLGMAVGLSRPGDFVLDGDPATLPKRGRSPPPIFGPCLFWPKGWMDPDAIWHGVKPWPRRRYVRWGRSSPPYKGHSPSFRSVSIVATVAHLSYC